MADYVTGEKDAVRVEEYNGQLSLLSMYNGYPQFAKYRVGKDKYADKDWPIKVKLGNKERAIATLQTILMDLQAGEGVKSDDDDAPF
jgi:hypothetical protein